MTMVDFRHDEMHHQWWHPDSGVRIDCIDMPCELLPEEK